MRHYERDPMRQRDSGWSAVSTPCEHCLDTQIYRRIRAFRRPKPPIAFPSSTHLPGETTSRGVREINSFLETSPGNTRFDEFGALARTTVYVHTQKRVFREITHSVSISTSNVRFSVLLVILLANFTVHALSRYFMTVNIMSL